MLTNQTELRIRIFGNPSLRKRARLVPKITYAERDIFSKMLKIMYEQGGIGLAAPQVGLDVQMIVADVNGAKVMLANPKIISRKGSQVFEEGCLSVPGFCIPIKRSKFIEVQGLNEKGEISSFKVGDLLSTCLQHEIDHLSGKLILDYLPLRKKFLLRSKINELKKKGKGQDVITSHEKFCKLEL